MSLFENKEWWSTKVGESEEFDSNHLCVGSIDSLNPNNTQIIIGSFEGKLRIYSPHHSEFKIEDLLFEKDFQNPIIKISLGRYLSISSENALSILFFKKLSVYTFITSDSTGGGLTYKLCYESNLPRNAYNMVSGSFGGIKNKDLICVQSCDGALIIYEQEKLISIVQINDFVLPSPIFYIDVIDSFILQNSAHELECYKYSNVAASFDITKKIKNLVAEWTINIGEQAMKISGILRNEKNYEIFVLTESMIFAIGLNGLIKNQKKLEFPASNFILYQNKKKEKGEESIGSFNLLITSFTNHLLVFDEFQLIWASRTNHVAHAIEIAKFDNQNGLIVSLNDEGWLEVSYLGTEIPLLTKGLIASEDIDYEKMDNTYNELIEKISNTTAGKQIKMEESLEKLKCFITVSDVFLSSEYYENSELFFRNENGQIYIIKIRVTLSYSGIKANNISLLFDFPHNIFLENNPIFIESLKGGGTPFNQEMELMCLCHEFPYKNSANLNISYYNSGESKEARSHIIKFNIPGNLQYKVVSPIKQADFKITIGISQELQGLHSIFSNEIKNSENKNEIEANPFVITFLLANGINCTIIVGKNANKFRIQSSCFEGLYFILLELIKRLKEKFGENLEIIYQESLPLQDFFQIIDDHFVLRKNLNVKKIELEETSNQFRIIQKRMLTRFKDKNSTPLNNLDVLFNRTYENLINHANKIEEIQLNLSDSSHRLTLGLELIIFLLKLRFGLKNNIYELIRNILICEFENQENDISWEEIIYANISFILKSLNKKENDVVPNITLHNIDDVEKLKKHITVFFDKISKGSLEQLDIFKTDNENLPLKTKKSKSTANK